LSSIWICRGVVASVVIRSAVGLIDMPENTVAFGDTATPKIPFWLMVFKNIRVFFLGSDDFPVEAKAAATRDLNDALQAGWPGFEIGERIPLSEIARAHELVEHPARRGRVVVMV
jgi:NADPH:quinone reductase-like Zn-dependent oxidoreductase